MPSVITVQDGSGATTTPDLILGYDTAYESRTIVHDTLDGGIAVSMIPPRPRAGTLHLFYMTETAANDAAQLHRIAAVFTLTTDERPTINMAYVVSGQIRVQLDDATRTRWTVDVGYQEVTQ